MRVVRASAAFVSGAGVAPARAIGRRSVAVPLLCLLFALGIWTVSDFRAAGLAHILAISGLYVSPLGGIAMLNSLAKTAVEHRKLGDGPATDVEGDHPSTRVTLPKPSSPIVTMREPDLPHYTDATPASSPPPTSAVRTGAVWVAVGVAAACALAGAYYWGARSAAVTEVQILIPTPAPVMVQVVGEVRVPGV